MLVIDNQDTVKHTPLGRAGVIPTYRRPRHNAAVTAVLMLISGVVAAWLLRKELTAWMMYVLVATDWLVILVVVIPAMLLGLLFVGIRTGNIQAVDRQMSE